MPKGCAWVARYGKAAIDCGGCVPGTTEATAAKVHRLSSGHGIVGSRLRAADRCRSRLNRLLQPTDKPKVRRDVQKCPNLQLVKVVAVLASAWHMYGPVETPMPPRAGPSCSSSGGSLGSSTISWQAVAISVRTSNTTARCCV